MGTVLSHQIVISANIMRVKAFFNTFFLLTVYYIRHNLIRSRHKRSGHGNEMDFGFGFIIDSPYRSLTQLLKPLRFWFGSAEMCKIKNRLIAIPDHQAINVRDLCLSHWYVPSKYMCLHTSAVPTVDVHQTMNNVVATVPTVYNIWQGLIYR
jgi:hypothetical protein